MGFHVGVTDLSLAPRFCPDGVLAPARTSLTRLELTLSRMSTIRRRPHDQVKVKTSSHRFVCQSAFFFNSLFKTSLTDASGITDINTSAHGFLCRYISKF